MELVFKNDDPHFVETLYSGQPLLQSGHFAGDEAGSLAGFFCLSAKRLASNSFCKPRDESAEGEESEEGVSSGTIAEDDGRRRWGRVSHCGHCFPTLEALRRSGGVRERSVEAGRLSSTTSI